MQLAQPKYRERKEKAKKAQIPSFQALHDVDPSEVSVLGTPTDENRAQLQPASDTTGKSKKRKKSGTPVRPTSESTPSKSSAQLVSPEQVMRKDVTVSQLDLLAMSKVFQDQLQEQTWVFSQSMKEER